jgi:hypothetical protein
MKITPLVFSLMLLQSCGNDNKPTEQKPTTPEIRNADTAIQTVVLENPYWFTIDSTGHVTMAGKAIKLEEVKGKLIDSLMSLKKAGKAMPDTIMYKTEGTVMMGIRGALKEAIDEACETVKK